jgi:chromosome segregation ATPase
MPVAQYLCDKCSGVLEKTASEKHPANLTYAPPNTTSYFFQCAAANCGAKFIAFEEESGKFNWAMKDEEAYRNILKGVNERLERTALKDEKEKLTQEKAQLDKMIADNPRKISILREEMENLKTQVKKLTDDYEEKATQAHNLEEAMTKGRKRSDDIDKRLKELIHVK